MFRKWNAIIATSLGTLLGIVGSPKGNSKEDSKLLPQKKKKKNLRRRRKPRLTKKKNLEESTT